MIEKMRHTAEGKIVQVVSADILRVKLKKPIGSLREVLVSPRSCVPLDSLPEKIRFTLGIGAHLRMIRYFYREHKQFHGRRTIKNSIRIWWKFWRDTWHREWWQVYDGRFFRPWYRHLWRRWIVGGIGERY